MKATRYAVLLLLLACSATLAQTRDEKVRSDKQELQDNDKWIYNDLERGIQTARAEDKPLLIVYRCIP